MLTGGVLRGTAWVTVASDCRVTRIRPLQLTASPKTDTWRFWGVPAGATNAAFWLEVTLVGTPDAETTSGKSPRCDRVPGSMMFGWPSASKDWMLHDAT